MEKIKITVNLCTKEEMQEAVEKTDLTTWYKNHLRGFCYPSTGEIWILKDCWGELALLAHEYGHIRGLKHCKFPGIMNFSGLFRWFANDPKDLLGFIKSILGALKK